MIGLLIKIITAFAAVSLPISFLWEKKYGLGKKARLFHFICAWLGVLGTVFVCILFNWKIESAVGDVRAWAEDFFNGYLKVSGTVVLVLTAILALAAAIDHPMRRVRTTVTVMLPIVMILVTLFVAAFAEDGQFAVDFWIRALSPGLGLMAHYVPVFDRSGKKKTA